VGWWGFLVVVGVGGGWAVGGGGGDWPNPALCLSFALFISVEQSVFEIARTPLYFKERFSRFSRFHSFFPSYPNTSFSPQSCALPPTL